MSHDDPEYKARPEDYDENEVILEVGPEDPIYLPDPTPDPITPDNLQPPT